MGRVVDGVSEVLDRRGRISTQPTPKGKAAGRVHRLKGLGNAVVPQVAEFIGRQIMKAITQQEAAADE
ncbi:hypothetical protein [Paremcibacter congregatus]|uniref:hypothetical protein n=1 Tax=Paremcibacter congregatus TaxID=2043170 RepID=UPI003A916760